MVNSWRSKTHSWSFQGWLEPLPIVLWPALLGIPAGWVIGRLLPVKGDRLAPRGAGMNPEAYLWWQITIALLGFALSPFLGLVDIRFLPFAQLFLVALGAIGWGKVIERLRYSDAMAALMVLGILVWGGAHIGSIPAWARWNYSGMEAKPLWAPFQDLTGT